MANKRLIKKFQQGGKANTYYTKENPMPLPKIYAGERRYIGDREYAWFPVKLPKNMTVSKAYDLAGVNLLNNLDLFRKLNPSVKDINKVREGQEIIVGSYNPTDKFFTAEIGAGSVRNDYPHDFYLDRRRELMEDEEPSFKKEIKPLAVKKEPSFMESILNSISNLFK